MKEQQRRWTLDWFDSIPKMVVKWSIQLKFLWDKRYIIFHLQDTLPRNKLECLSLVSLINLEDIYKKCPNLNVKLLASPTNVTSTKKHVV